MSKLFVEEAIIELKSRCGLYETKLVQESLDSLQVTNLNNQYLFWQIYLKQKGRFITRNILIIQFSLALIYMMFLSYGLSSQNLLNKYWFIFILWITGGFLTWIISLLVFPYWPMDKKISDVPGGILGRANRIVSAYKLAEQISPKEVQ